jgi:hypothetical protein
MTLPSDASPNGLSALAPPGICEGDAAALGWRESIDHASAAVGRRHGQLELAEATLAVGLGGRDGREGVLVEERSDRRRRARERRRINARAAGRKRRRLAALPGCARELELAEIVAAGHRDRERLRDLRKRLRDGGQRLRHGWEGVGDSRKCIGDGWERVGDRRERAGDRR